MLPLLCADGLRRASPWQTNEHLGHGLGEVGPAVIKAVRTQVHVVSYLPDDVSLLGCIPHGNRMSHWRFG